MQLYKPMRHSLPQSLAENRLDHRIYRRFYRGNGIDFSLIEVGAARPDYLSMSAFFRQLGWRVISIEPNPVFCELQRNAGNDILCYACGDHNEDDVDFIVVDSLHADYRQGKVTFESFSSLGLKSAYAMIKPELPTSTIKVKLRKLDTILAAHAPDVNKVDIVVVDVEGWELEVMAGFSLSRYRPGCVVLENLFSDKRYVKYMNERGYTLWRTIPPNEIYVSTSFAVGRAEFLFWRVYDRLLSLRSRLNVF